MEASFEIDPQGPFSLAAARDFLGGFTPAAGSFTEGRAGITMAFPVDGWRSSAATVVWQDGDVIRGRASDASQIELVRGQVARTLSLDHDGSGWPDVGRRDPVIGRMQEEFDYLRPVCFYSPYEAAASAIIGHRISMAQAAAVKRRLAESLGERFALGDQSLNAFPLPQRLLELESVAGLPLLKIPRLHAIARAALDGRLDPGRLRSLSAAEASAELKKLPGIGDWSAAHIRLRGAGIVDELPLADPRSRDAVAAAYGLREPPSDARMIETAEGWRPYRMWAIVLLRLAHGRLATPA
jgi:DNA-3-methyladenine glycosylase II